MDAIMFWIIVIEFNSRSSYNIVDKIFKISNCTRRGKRQPLPNSILDKPRTLFHLKCPDF